MLAALSKELAILSYKSSDEIDKGPRTYTVTQSYWWFPHPSSIYDSPESTGAPAWKGFEQLTNSKSFRTGVAKVRFYNEIFSITQGICAKASHGSLKMPGWPCNLAALEFRLSF